MDRLGARAAIVAMVAWCACLASVAQARPVYVDVNEANRVAVIDSQTNELTGTSFETAPVPQKLSISPDGRYLYLAHTGGNAITVIDTTTGKQVGGPIPVGEAPTGIAITPDGRFAYVANNNESTVSVVDTQARDVVKTIYGFDISDDVAISPDGKRAYVANIGGDSVSVVDTSTNAIVGLPIPSAGGPTALTVSSDGHYLYVAEEAGYVRVIDTATDEPVGSTIPAGTLADAIAITPDGSQVYVSDYGSEEVTAIDTATKSTTQIALGKLPAGLAVNPDGKSLYVTEENPESVSVIDTAKNESVKTITSLGRRPEDVVVAPDQPPSAAFTAGPVARPGVPVSFDGSASSDPDGRIASWSWSFGDGGSATGGPAQSHVFAAPGAYPVTLTLSDELGCSTQPVYDGHEDFCAGGPAASHQETVTVAYPSVRIACPKRALRPGCRVKLQVVARKRGRAKGRPRLTAETAIAKLKLKRGKSALVPVVPKPAFGVQLASATKALVRAVVDFRARSGRAHEVKLVSKRVS